MENNAHKILIVDDNEKNIQILASLLSEKNYNVDYALNGFDALKLIDTEDLDLILLDITMPEMDGLEVCKRIKENPKKKQIPIIFLTAKTDVDSIEKAFEHGGQDYLNKPFNSKELLARVKTHIELKTNRDKLKNTNKWLEKRVIERTEELKRMNAEKLKLERQFINSFIEAQEVEKQKFGEELHDGVNQILSAEGMYIGLLNRPNQDRINDNAELLNKIKELNLSAINEVKNISQGLMSYQLKRNGLVQAIKNICSDFSSTNNITFRFIKKNVNEEELSDVIKTNLFRVVQEIATNIVRHSLANKASIVLSKLNNGRLKLMIKDNGIGFNRIKSDSTGLGTKNLERRIIFLNGTLDVNSVPNKGTSYTIEVPLLN